MVGKGIPELEQALQCSPWLRPPMSKSIAGERAPPVCSGIRCCLSPLHVPTSYVYLLVLVELVASMNANLHPHKLLKVPCYLAHV